MDKILHELPRSRPVRADDIVFELEKYLGRARAGRLRGLAIVAIEIDGGKTNSWISDSTEDVAVMIGVMEWLKSRLISALDNIGG